nr:hypothetical protein [Tanacetum cinerariifolium]
MPELMKDVLYARMRMEHHDGDRSESERIIPGKGDLLDYWSDISTDRDFLGPPPSYTLIRDLVLRLYHRMMAHSIAGPARKEADAGGVVEEALVAPKGGDKDEEMPQSVPPPPSTQGIEEDDYDSERDTLILEEFLSNDSLSLPENESFHFDISSSFRPPAKLPDGNSGVLNVKVMGDISKHK